MHHLEELAESCLESFQTSTMELLVKVMVKSVEIRSWLSDALLWYYLTVRGSITRAIKELVSPKKIKAFMYLFSKSIAKAGVYQAAYSKHMAAEIFKFTSIKLRLPKYKKPNVKKILKPLKLYNASYQLFLIYMFF